jgi:hypothetical protein
MPHFFGGSCLQVSRLAGWHLQTERQLKPVLARHREDKGRFGDGTNLHMLLLKNSRVWEPVIYRIYGRGRKLPPGHRNPFNHRAGFWNRTVVPIYGFVSGRHRSLRTGPFTKAPPKIKIPGL